MDHVSAIASAIIQSHIIDSLHAYAILPQQMARTLHAAMNTIALYIAAPGTRSVAEGSNAMIGL